VLDATRAWSWWWDRLGLLIFAIMLVRDEVHAVENANDLNRATNSARIVLTQVVRFSSPRSCTPA